MSQLQDLYEYLNKASMSGMSERSANHVSAAIAIVKQMMQAEPVHQHRVRYCADWYDGSPDTSDGKHYEARTLYAAPQSVPAVTEGKTCSNCTFHYKDIDMKPCSNCERGDNIEDNWMPMSTGQIALAAAPKGGL